MGGALPGSGPALAAPASTTVAAVPSAPFHLTTRAGVDGVEVSWWRGSVAAAPAPTSYVVRRHAEGHDLTWVVPTAPSSAMWSASDTTLPVGLPATYTVAGRSAGGDGEESAPITATVPAWEGPYTPARRSLTMVWDQLDGLEDAAGIRRVSLQGTQPAAAPTTQDWANGLIGFSAGLVAAFALPPDVPDGDYAVGPDPGQLRVRATSTGPCSAPGGLSPSG